MTVLDEMIASLEASAPPETPLTEEDLARIRDLDLTSCDFCGGGCCDPDCWRCYSPLSPENLRTLAKNLAQAAMLCRAWQLRDEDSSWRPGCNIDPGAST
ncbi:MAG TPA: hypothetical protein VLE97_11460 [Gaiellaceae bacterium]|nr:hypothetical protein [Gaiellaceae bacterium]